MNYVRSRGDVPGIKPQDAQSKMGKGPSMLTFDAGMIPNQPLKELVIDTVKQCKIPLQLTQMKGGRTDGAPIHVSRALVVPLSSSVSQRGISTTIVARSASKTPRIQSAFSSSL